MRKFALDEFLGQKYEKIAKVGSKEEEKYWEYKAPNKPHKNPCGHAPRMDLHAVSSQLHSKFGNGFFTKVVDLGVLYAWSLI